MQKKIKPEKQIRNNRIYCKDLMIMWVYGHQISVNIGNKVRVEEVNIYFLYSLIS